MAKKICVVNVKGGVGKTTLSVHIATALAKSGPVLLIDADPQASAASWAAWRRDNQALTPSPTTVCLAGKAVFDEGKRLANNYDFVVTDAGGRDNAGLRSALLLSDLAIVPIGASNFDAAAMTDLLEVIELAKDFNPALTVRVMLMRLDPRLKNGGKDAVDMLDYLGQNGLSVLDSRVCERVAFRRATGDGATVEEIGKDPQATAEVAALMAEIKAKGF
ncbi:MAG: ParA family protein [Rhodobacteraceae bacterium]|nr:ParA family protein [Paracoccaceae bacterium]